MGFICCERIVHVCNWPEAAVERCLLFRRCQGISRHLTNGLKIALVTPSRHKREDFAATHELMGEHPG